MASSKPLASEELSVPSNVLKNCSGLGLDIGGSAIKVIYRSKEQYDLAILSKKPRSESTISVASFPKTNLEEAISYIKSKVYLTKSPGDDKDIQVYATGFGCYQSKDKLESEIGIKLTILDEVSSAIDGLQFLLKNCLASDLSHELDKSAVDRSIADIKSFEAVMKSRALNTTKRIYHENGIKPEEMTMEQLIKDGIDSLIPDTESQAVLDDSVYPVGLAVLGSGHGIFKVQKDGTYSYMEFSSRGGKSCYGLACLLLGCKDFEEFLELAGKGKANNVDVSVKSLTKAVSTDSSKDNDLYDAIVSAGEEANPLICCFGQAATKSMGDFKKEDVAAALLRYYCNDLTNMIDNALQQPGFHDVKHLFVGGGFPNNALTRQVITQELTARVPRKILIGIPHYQYKFHLLKLGQHLGALGCLVNSI